MSIFSNLIQKYKRATPKQFMLTGVFMLAFAAAVVGGFASKQHSSAADQTYRDCTYNAIDHNRIGGGCGALTIPELCEDIWTNSPGDLRSIYNEFGFQTSDCDSERFQNQGKHGVITKNGDVIVDGEVVMTNAWTMGRTTLGGAQRTPYNINGTTYYHSHPSASFGQNSLDVMVLFDADGTLEFAVMESCGNPVTTGNKVKSGAECKELQKYAVSGKENTYQFSTDASKFGLAKYVKFNYYYNDGSGDKLFDSKANPSDKTKEITFTKSSTVRVEIEISLPGGNKKTITSTLCSKQIGVVKKEFLHVCDALVATSSDNKTFRFTLKTKQSNGVTVKSADFKEGNATVKGVTLTDADGKIYRDYTFTDYVEHTVTASKVTFVVEGKDVIVTTPKGDCEASVTREKAPECKPGIPVGDDRCKDFCKPGIEVGSKECEELPVTGPGGVAGLFVGVSAAGAAAHRMFMSRRARRS